MNDYPFVPVSAWYTPEYRAALAEIDRRRALVKAAYQDLRAAVLAAEKIASENRHLLDELVEVTI